MYSCSPSCTAASIHPSTPIYDTCNVIIIIFPLPNDIARLALKGLLTKTALDPASIDYLYYGTGASSSLLILPPLLIAQIDHHCADRSSSS